MIEIRLLGEDDGGLLDRSADGVFDGPVVGRWRDEFLADPRHHLAVAVDESLVVGMASAVHYVHPDKPPELWINEIGVAPNHRRRGIGRQLVRCLLAHARVLGCSEAWVLTDRENVPARALFSAVGGAESDSPVSFEFGLCRPEGDDSNRD